MMYIVDFSDGKRCHNAIMGKFKNVCGSSTLQSFPVEVTNVSYQDSLWFRSSALVEHNFY